MITPTAPESKVEKSLWRLRAPEDDEDDEAFAVGVAVMVLTTVTSVEGEAIDAGEELDGELVYILMYGISKKALSYVGEPGPMMLLYICKWLQSIRRRERGNKTDASARAGRTIDTWDTRPEK